MYEGRHPILFAKDKPPFKPDNRIVANFAKYIVDVLNGYFIGKPVKTLHKNLETAEKIHDIEKYNDQDDNNSEISKMCSIYGNAFELLYVNEESKICMTYFSPMEAFIVYDDSVARKPLYGVRYYCDKDKVMYGSVYSRDTEYFFTNSGGGLRFLNNKRAHNFNGVPLIEYIENEERTGAFEHVSSLITAYSKALSEKANDVDYFGDSYLKILGSKLDEETLITLRDNRIINLESFSGDKVEVEFMQKPDADATQEHFLDRLEKEIFSLSMVANISDEEFGNATGNALAYKLLAMDNLCRMKERKFVSGMNRRWKLIFSHILSNLHPDDYIDITYQFTRNAPHNLLEEVETAAKMAGISSRKTQLKVISAIDNVEAELDEISKENGTIPKDELRAERSF